MAGRNARSGAASQRLTADVITHWGGLCWLQLDGCTKRATTKDHVIPVDHGGTDDMRNLRPACHSCNSKRGNLAISGAGGIEVTVIVGPPSPEQQAHALAHRQPEDVVIDRDLIAAAIAAPGSLAALHVDKVVSRAYSAAVQQALRMGARCGVWIVHPVPTLRQLHQYARLRYHVVTIDPGRAVAEHHAMMRGGRALLLDVSTWYARYPEGAASIERARAPRPSAPVERPTAAATARPPSRAW